MLDSSKMRLLSTICSCFVQLTALVIAIAVTALAQGQTTVRTGTFSSVTSTSIQTKTPDDVGRDSALRLGTGDLVDVSVYNVPELATKIRVNGDGNISLPLIDDVHVEGLTIEEAEAAIEQRLDRGGFVKNPHVQIFVQENTSQSASVLGEVAKPGIYPIIGDEKLFSLVSAAGGFTDRAGKNVTVTHRGEAPIVVPISHNLEDHPESNIDVLPGDTVMVRRADVVYVVGDVGRPSGFLMENGHISVLQAIALAGGTNSTAKLSAAKIIRKGTTGLTSVPVPLKKLMQAKANDLPMQADDILFVPTSSRKQMEARTAEAAAQLATAVGVVAVHP
ncbi:MAG TPA: polysaccharide biosynthesis/export family protein [Terriglobales bacterium]|nr:polysaccharide biosynthesis/export family protein [Terriglobales bacterium]